MEADDHQDDDIKESMSDVEDDKDSAKVSPLPPPSQKPLTPFSVVATLTRHPFFFTLHIFPPFFRPLGGDDLLGWGEGRRRLSV